jgi:hypothetical protein
MPLRIEARRRRAPNTLRGLSSYSSVGSLRTLESRKMPRARSSVLLMSWPSTPRCLSAINVLG